ncbi:MAG: hypothetical protein ACRC6S_15480 [Shewanella sp.]
MVEENRSHINQRHDLVEVLFLVLTAVQQLITMLNIEGALLTNDGVMRTLLPEFASPGSGHSELNIVLCAVKLWH